MPDKKHIAIICSRLDLPGGIERAICNTANLFNEHQHPVTLIITDVTNHVFYPLNPGIRLIQQNLDFGITKEGSIFLRKKTLLLHVQQLRNLLHNVQSDVLISSEYHLSIVAKLAMRRQKVPIFSWEHHHFYYLKKNRFWSFLFRLLYPKLHTIICLNETEASYFKSIGCITTVIPNFISPQQKATLQGNRLLTIGWLIKRKGVDMIPKIAEKIFAKHPHWQWQIIGEGKEEKALRATLLEKNLQQKVMVIKPVGSDLNATYQQASLYVMTSRFECFPMVLLEAMSHGVPCISFQCPTGPADIIENNVDGILVEKENVEAMAETIIEVMGSLEKRTALGENAFQNIQRFSPEKIYRLWEQLFESL